MRDKTRAHPVLCIEIQSKRRYCHLFEGFYQLNFRVLLDSSEEAENNYGLDDETVECSSFIIIYIIIIIIIIFIYTLNTFINCMYLMYKITSLARLNEPRYTSMPWSVPTKVEHLMFPGSLTLTSLSSGASTFDI